MEILQDILNIARAGAELLLDNWPKIVFLITLFVAFIEYKCKKLAYETALLSLQTRAAEDGSSLTQLPTALQVDQIIGHDDLTPESFCRWIKHRRTTVQK